jgi:glycine cleavage system H protein
VESVKAASDVYAPVAGTVVEVNSQLEITPTLLNTGAESDGWICKIKLAPGAEAEWKALLDAGAYKKHCEAQK